MPRTGKGGKVDGAVGKAYANRTDLNAATKTVPNQEYGKATAQKMAMANVPMASAPQAPTPPQPSMGGQPPQMPQRAQAFVPPPQQPGPGEFNFLEPTQRPQEPITSGLSSGPGPGPEILQNPMQQRNDYLSSTLGELSRMPDAPPELARLAALLGQRRSV